LQPAVWDDEFLVSSLQQIQDPAAFAANCPVPLELKIAMMPKLP
jgi:hypothetical protein